MHPQAIRVCSARDACRLEAGKFVNFPVFTGKLHVTQVNCARDFFYLRTACKLTCVCRKFCTRQFYSVRVQTKIFSENIYWKVSRFYKIFELWAKHSWLLLLKLQFTSPSDYFGLTFCENFQNFFNFSDLEQKITAWYPKLYDDPTEFQ